jgi:glycosyltransferase involved in cell wall biosynthesis
MSKEVIVHATSVHPVGDPRICSKECRSLSEAGYSVCLVVPGTGSYSLEGVDVEFVAPPRNRWDRIFRTARTVVLRALEFDPVIIHLHDPELVPWIPFIRARGVRVVFDMHEDFPLQLAQKQWVSSWLRPLLRFSAKCVERVFLPWAAVVYAEKSYAGSRGWVRHSVEVLNYPDLNIFEEIDEQQGDGDIPSIGYMGSITAERGIFVILDALRILRDSGQEVRFCCIGDGPAKTLQSIRNYVIKHNLKGVELVGYVPPEVGVKHLMGCMVGLAVLQPLPNYVDSYPTKIFEYMALGLPSIVSDFPLYSGLVNDCQCGVTVDPTDSLALAQAIGMLVVDDNIRAEMGRRGRKKAMSDYSWDSQARKLIGFYELLLQDA